MGKQPVQNDYALEAVPASQRKGWFTMFSVMIAIGIDLSSVLLGAELSAGMTLDKAIWSVILGSLILSVFSTLCAIVGSSTHFSTSMIMRRVFGEYGALVFSLLIGISLIGWYGVQVGFFADNAAAVLSSLFSWDASVKLLSLIGGLLMMTTAIFGYKAIEKLSVWSVPLLLILMLVTLILGLTRYDLGAAAAPDPSMAMTLGSGISYVISIFIVGSAISPDISRWAKSRKDAVISTFFGMFLGNSFMIIIAILLSKAMQTDDIMRIFVTLGMGIPGILVLTLAQWTTNNSNIYSSSLGFSVVFKKIPKSYLAIILGLVGTGLAVIGIYNQFLTFLNYLAIAIAPTSGIYVAEYFVVRKELKESSLKQAPRNWVTRSLAAWIIGIVVTYLSTPQADGAVLLSLTTIPALDGFLAGFIAQTVIGLIAVSAGSKANTNHAA